MVRFVPALECREAVENAIKTQSYRILGDTLNAYLDGHQDKGCVLAELRLYPANCEIVSTSKRAHHNYTTYRYITAPQARCKTCPFWDCIADGWELTTHICATNKALRAQGGFYDLSPLPAV